MLAQKEKSSSVENAADSGSVVWIDTEEPGPRRSLRRTHYEHQDNIVFAYFEEKKIKSLFDFMVQHLIIYEPDNPIEYLKDLADKLLMWRSGTVSKAPQLFEERHVEAIYKALDPGDTGTISLEQYHNGFNTLMLEKYIMYPRLHANGEFVEKDIFIKNVMTALDKNLMSLVMPPYSTLCELTILPNESYDILFKNESEEEVSPRKSLDQITKKLKKEPSEMSCLSSDSCVKRIRAEDERESVISEVSFYSEDEDGSLDLEANEFLTRSFTLDDDELLNQYSRKATLQGSKITILGGKVGHLAKTLLDEDLSLDSFTLQSSKEIK